MDFSADIVDLTRYAESNDGYNYALVVQRFDSTRLKKNTAWVVLLYRMSGVSIAMGLKSLFEDPKLGFINSRIHTKHYKFINPHVREILDIYNITLMCNFENFTNTTLRVIDEENNFADILLPNLGKYFLRSKCYRYVDILPNIVHQYNLHVNNEQKRIVQKYNIFQRVYYYVMSLFVS